MWRRLFGDRPREGFAIPIAAIGGGRLWVWDRSGRDVDHGRVVPVIGPAIEREVRLAVGANR